MASSPAGGSSGSRIAAVRIRLAHPEQAGADDHRHVRGLVGVGAGLDDGHHPGQRGGERLTRPGRPQQPAAGLAGDRRVHDRPAAAQLQHRCGCGDQLVHLLGRQRLPVQGDLPGEGEGGVLREDALLERLLPAAPGAPGPGVLPVEDRGRREVATEAARPQHVDRALPERTDAVGEQAGELLGVEGDLVGHPQREQAVEHRPGLRRGPQRDRGVGAGAVPNPWVDSGPVSVHSRAASHTWSGSCSSCTCSTSRTDPATSSSSAASTRSEIRTSWGRSSVAPRRIPSTRARSRAAKSLPSSVPAGRDVREDGAPGRGAVRVPARGLVLVGAARGMVSTTAASTRRTRSSAVGSSPARVSTSIRTRSASSGDSSTGRQAGCGVSRSTGSKRPAATTRMPSSAAPASSPTLGCRSSRRCARVRTGSAARIGSATVRRASLNSTTPSRGGSPGVKVAGPVTGTKLM